MDQISKYSNVMTKDPEYVHRIKNQIRLTLAKYILIDGFVNFFEESTENELQNFLNMDGDFYFNLNYNINPHKLFEIILNKVSHLVGMVEGIGLIRKKDIYIIYILDCYLNF